MINVIRSLKGGKAPGPDMIPNEAMKNCNAETLQIFKNEMNKILKSMTIPEQWTEGTLKRLYKGKGVKAFQFNATTTRIMVDYEFGVVDGCFF